MSIVKEILAEADLKQADTLEALFQNIRTGKAGEADLQFMMNNPDAGLASLAKGVMRLSLDPFVTYGVGPETVPQPDVGQGQSSKGWGAEVLELLDNLASRQLTGHAARDAIQAVYSGLGYAEYSLLYRVLVKELRIGFGPKSINKYHRALIPVFELKGAKKTKEALHKMSWPCHAEIKYDGWRCVIKTDGVSVETFSRNGLPMPNLMHRAEELRQLTAKAIEGGYLKPGVWAWDGEAKAEGHFNETSSAARRKGKGEDLTYFVFDLLPFEQMAEGREMIEVRYNRIAEVLPLAADFPLLKPAARWEIDEEADAWELFNMVVSQGLGEGLILKRKGSMYIAGKNNDWVKVKPEETLDLVITGLCPGEKGSKYEGLIGAIQVDYKGVTVRVGSGLTDAMRNGDIATGLVAEIAYHEETPDGSLREPRLKAIRKDKHPEDADQ